MEYYSPSVRIKDANGISDTNLKNDVKIGMIRQADGIYRPDHAATTIQKAILRALRRILQNDKVQSY